MALAWNSRDEEAECQQGGYPRPDEESHARFEAIPSHPDEKEY